MTLLHLWDGDSNHFTGECERSSLHGPEVLQLLVKERGDAPARGDGVMLHLIIRLLHWCPLQAKLNLTHQPLLKVRHLVLLERNGEESHGVSL